MIGARRPLRSWSSDAAFVGIQARLVSILTLVLASPAPALANSAPALWRGERHGVLVPRTSTNLRIEHETLSFVIDTEGEDARVAAEYRITAVAAETAELAFAFVRAPGGYPTLTRVDASVELDGAAVELVLTTDGEILEPLLKAWIAERPETARALEEADAAGRSDRDPEPAAKRAGGPCALHGCPALVKWYSMRGARDPGLPLRREWALEAAREAIPEKVEELQRGWSTLPEERRLAFLLFRAGWSAGQTRNLTVRYRHQPTRDATERIDRVNRFEYLLSPAGRWASFGPLEISVRAPPELLFEANLPFEGERGSYRARFDALPRADLSFSLTRKRGLWLGPLGPSYSVAVLFALMLGSSASLVWLSRRSANALRGRCRLA